MSIYIGDKEIKDLYIGDTPVKEAYLGDTKVRPSSSLKSYEEIVAMATAEGTPFTNTVAELNSNAEAYYNMLNDGNHIVTKTDFTGDEITNCVDGICNESGGETMLIRYDNSSFYSGYHIGSLC